MIRTCVCLAMMAFVLACGGSKDPEPAPAMAPAITAQPTAQNVTAGHTATFTVSATGTAPLSYQWKKNGFSVGTNSTSYTTAAATTADNGATLTVVVSNAAGQVESQPATLTVNPEGTSYTFPAPLAKLTTRADVLALVTGATYYVDANGGSDTTGDGTSLLPWQTLAKAHTVLQSGGCVVMRTGHYGTFNREVLHSVPTVYIADVGHAPVLSNLRLRDDDAPSHTVGIPETAFKANLVFYGIHFVPEYVEPGGDPMDPEATESTYAKCTNAIDLKWFGAIKFIHCPMSPSDTYGTDKKFLSLPAISLVNAPDIWIEGCDLDSFGSGINYTGAPGLRIYHNKIHGVCGGMISNKDARSLDAVIEGNHLFDSNWAITDPYCPRRSVADYHHGSFMSVRGCNTVIRNNIMHYGCNSSGMMLYDDMGVPFDNILIEGNQIYDSNNVYALRLYNVNSNVVVRNNTLISKGRYGSTQDWKYNEALAIHSFLGSAIGKRLSIHNNVIVGHIGLPASLDEIDMEGNIVYSTTVTLPEGNITAYPGSHTYYESGFFAGELDVSWQNWENDGAGFANPRGHGKLLDLRLAAGSPAIGYGVPTQQAPAQIGGIDADGFLPLSLVRTPAEHSAGAMEQ